MRKEEEGRIRKDLGWSRLKNGCLEREVWLDKAAKAL
jgi:hypothetical protein